MLQESVLSATYICSLQIPGNRLIQTLLIDSKSQVCVMTHGTGGADAILPFIARRRIKEASPQIKKCGRKTIPNTNSSHPGPAHSTRAASREVCPLAEDPYSQRDKSRNRKGAAGLCAGDVAQRWRVAKCDSTRALPLELHPLYARSNKSVLAWGIFPSYCVRKAGPKNFSSQAVTFLSPSSSRGILPMENWINAEPIVVNCECCYSFSRLVLALQLAVYLDCHSWALLLFSWQSSC